MNEIGASKVYCVTLVENIFNYIRKREFKPVVVIPEDRTKIKIKIKQQEKEIPENCVTVCTTQYKKNGEDNLKCSKIVTIFWSEKNKQNQLISFDRSHETFVCRISISHLSMRLFTSPLRFRS